MAIERLRPAYTDAELKEVYSHTYDHMRWMDHQVRIEKTIEFGKQAGQKIKEGAKKVANFIKSWF